MSQNDDSDVLEELFGGSEGEENEKLDNEIEENKKKTPNGRTKLARKKSQSQDDEEVVEELDDKILEARRDFEEALSKLKGPNQRRKGIDSDSVNYDDMAVAFINKMYDALKRDDEAVKAEKPALAKLKMLDEVCEMITRKHLQEVFLDNQVLDAIKKWLEPNIRGHLSVPNLRKRLLELLQSLPIETVHLRESGIGRIVMFYYQRKAESLEIRKLAGDLITTWSRPIIGTSLNYSEMIQNASSNDNDLDTANSNDKSTIKRLQSDNYKKMARSGALERETGGDQRYRQIINRQKNRKRD